MRYGGRMLVAVGLAALAGCGDFDPWSEMSRTPPSPSSPFVGSAGGEGGATSRPVGSWGGRELTLPECIQVACERNPQTAVSWQAARAAAARVGQARSAYLPTVGFTSSAARGTPAGLDDSAGSGARNAFEVVFGVRQMLFDGGGRESRVRGAAADLLAANFRHNAVLHDVALAVEEGYYDLLAAQKLREVAVVTVRQRDYHVRMAEARYETGLVPKSDVLKAQTEKADADLELVRAENAVRIARSRLASAMGLHVSDSFEIVDVPEDAQHQELAGIESLLDEAARERPELRAALAQIEVQRAAVKGAEARYWPAVSLSADLGWADRTFFPGQDQWSIGLALDAPLFTGFDRTYQVHRAKADLARAVAERQNALRGVELEVWMAYWQIIESGQAMDAAGRFLASAEESARVAEGEYKNGTGSIIGLVDAQTARTVARTRLIQARLGWHTAMARFEWAVGRTLAASEVPVRDKVGP